MVQAGDVFVDPGCRTRRRLPSDGPVDVTKWKDVSFKNYLDVLTRHRTGIKTQSGVRPSWKRPSEEVVTKWGSVIPSLFGGIPEDESGERMPLPNRSRNDPKIISQSS